MKTVNDLIQELQALKPSLRDKPVVVVAQNGLLFEAAIKFNMTSLGTTDVDEVVITHS